MFKVRPMLKTAFSEFIATRSMDFFIKDIYDLLNRRQKCVSFDVAYVVSKCFVSDEL